MIRRIRLVTGLFLFSYVFSHLLNHSLGILSLEMMESWRPIFQMPFGNTIGRSLLLIAILIHIVLAFHSLFMRRKLAGMSTTDGIQMLFGLAIPPMLLLHVIGTAWIAEMYDSHPSYPWLMLIFWKYDVALGLRQAVVLLLAWSHGCIGLYHWLHVKPWWIRYRLFAFIPALLVPVLALLGYLQAGKEILTLATDFNQVSAIFAAAQAPSNQVISSLYDWHEVMITGYFICIALVLMLRSLRGLWERRNGRITVTYDNGVIVSHNQGINLLDASRLGGVAHASVCGGRGRCSTCRVRVRKGMELIPEATEAEQRVLDRIKAGDGVRLACQCIPAKGQISITPLLPENASTRDGFARPDYLAGKEMEIAVLFADLRDFTRISEHRLPYDVVFLLNRYSHAMGTAIEDNGGKVDKFIGDGVMALFGVGKDPKQGCREALNAARTMAAQLSALNIGLSEDLDQPLRIGIGIHFGAAIVGEMGYGSATQLTAVGDTVNTASRIETMTKEQGVQLLVSDSVAQAADVDLSHYPCTSFSIRGKDTQMNARLIKEAEGLPVFDVKKTETEPQKA